MKTLITSILLFAAVFLYDVNDCMAANELRISLEMPSFSTVFPYGHSKVLLVGFENLPSNLKFVDVSFSDLNVSFDTIKIRSSVRYTAARSGFLRIPIDSNSFTGPGCYKVNSITDDSGNRYIVSNLLSVALLYSHDARDSKDGFIGIADLWGLEGASLPFDESVAIYLRQANVSSIRVFVGWDIDQNDIGFKNLYSRFDQLVTICSKYEINILPVLGYSTKFFRNTDIASRPGSSPPDFVQWKKFVADFSSKYASVLSEYEIWNEPNVKPFWNGSVNDYLKILKIASDEIRVNDKSAKIITGGLSGVDMGWATSIISSNVSYDAFAVHPYRYSQAYLEYPNVITGAKNYGQNSFIDDLINIEQAFKKANIISNIYITEIGFNTLQKKIKQELFTPPLGFTEQASLIARSAILAKAQGATKFYNWQFADTFGLGTGIITNSDNDFVPKPSLSVICFLNSILKYSSVVSGQQTDGVHKYTINNSGKIIVAYWSPYKKTSILVSVDHYADMFGRIHQAKNESGGKYRVDLDDSPIFIYQ